MYKVSVIVPIYNKEKTIKKCINSILKQQMDAIEIILINDGSSDKSGILCDQYAQQNSNIRVIHQENKGVSSARNIGIDAANGEYIGFVDCDDDIENMMMFTLYNLAKKYNADIVSSKFNLNTCNGESGKYTVIDDNKKCIEAYFDGKVEGTACTKIFRNELLKNVRFDSKYKINEDKLFVFKALEQSQKIILSDHKFYNYYLNNESATHTGSYKKWLDMLYVSDDINEIVNSKYPELIKESITQQIGVYIMMYRTLIKARHNEFVDMHDWNNVIDKIKSTRICDLKMEQFTREQRLSYIGIRYFRVVYTILYKVFSSSRLYIKHKKRSYKG